MALVTEQGYKVSEAARSLGINCNQLQRWKQPFADEASSSGRSADVREELKRLLKENRMLRMEHEAHPGAALSSDDPGKIERWHRSLMNQVLLASYYLPGDLKRRIEAFVRYYNTERHHESLKNLTQTDVYYGRGQNILNLRQKTKQRTLNERRRLHYQQKVA